MKQMLKVALLFAIAPLAVVAAEPANLVIADAWVRALPPGQPNTAAYMMVTNSSSETVTIVEVSADIAKKTEIHTSRDVDGYQRMEQLQQLSLAPGQSQAFAPGGMHLMLFGLEQMPAEGEQVQLCLKTAAGNETCTTAGVRRGVDTAQSHEHHQH